MSHKKGERSVGLAIKRAIDLLVAGMVLILTLPIWLLVATSILATMGPPVFFRQRRLGLDGREFTIRKFRTMTEARSDSGDLLEDQQRLTRTGQLLRGTSLDELPELLNVLSGQMSLVGPRPLLPEYRQHYSPEQWRRHEVKPGLFGPVTASGRNSLDWEEKLRLDVWYVDNWSLLLDLRLLVRSVVAALRREGISAEGHATMPRFDETNKRSL